MAIETKATHGYPETLISPPMTSTNCWALRRLGTSKMNDMRSLDAAAGKCPATQTEAMRLRRLAEYNIAQTAPEPAYDEIVRLAANLFDAPIAYIGIAEAQTIWVKAGIGTTVTDIPRAASVSDHAMTGDGMLCVPDAAQDPRFASFSQVVDSRQMRFFAVAPLIDSDGFKLGVIAVADRMARAPFTAPQEDALLSLARLAVDRLELRRRDAQLEAARTRLRDAVDVMPEGVLCVDADDRIVFWNQRYAEMFPQDAGILATGRTFEELLRSTASLDYGQYLDDPDPAAIEAWIIKRLADHRARRDRFEKTLKDGRHIRYDQRATSDGGAICTRVDITDLRLREESFRVLFDDNPLPMMVYDIESLKILNVNGAAIGHFGFSRGQFLSMTTLDIRPPEYRAEAEASLRARRGRKSGGDSVLWKADGSRFIGSTHSRTLQYQGHNASVTTTIDVTDQRRHEEQVQHVANHDILTGLPNRRGFTRQFDEILRWHAETALGFSLLLIDFDGLKGVNDTFGHRFGDELLAAAAKRMQGCIGESDLIARISGDEFAVLKKSSPHPESDETLAKRLVAEMERPFEILGERIDITISIGIGMASAPRDGNQADIMMQEADLALYSAKSAGRGRYHVFEPEMLHQVLAVKARERDLRLAMHRQEFLLHYQPLVRIKTGEVIGYEALIRWNHPQRGVVYPDDFIKIAENSGLIGDIGTWALMEACMAAAVWPEPLKIAVNVSAVQFHDRGFVSAVHDALASSGLEPRRLELEITESVLLDNSGLVMATLQGLRRHGICISMDDFGKGYSSLSYLQEFPIDKIKIDRAFVSGMVNNAKSRRIVHAVLAIGKSMKIRVQAEGIETPQECAALVKMGCIEGQGYYFGKPGPLPATPRAQDFSGLSKTPPHDA